MGKVCIAVHLEPLLLRARAQETFEIAPRMQALSAPVRGGEQRHVDFLQLDHARAVIVVDERAAQRLAGRVGAVPRQRLRRQRLRPGCRFAGDLAARALVTDAVLHAQHLALVPAFDELAKDAAMARKLAVVVGKPFPDAQCGKMRRPQRTHLPLVSCEVGDTVEPDLAGAPGLRPCPFDAEVEVARLARGPDVDSAGRAASAARVYAHADVAVRHPFLRIDQLPALVLIARTFEHFGRRLGQPRPVGLVALLEGEPFCIGTIAEDDRIAALGRRTEDIRAQNDAVVHRDRRVPIDSHAVANFAVGAYRASGC